MPHWLVTLAWIGVGLGVASAAWVIADLLAHRRQKMWIMNVVWPVTALWAGPIGAWAYLRFGRAGGGKPRFPIQVAKAATHCGSGCTLGDIGAELLFLVVPFTIFGHRLFGAWVYDFVAAFVIGVAFQYFTIKPMRHESPKEGLRDAIEADALSLTAWQIGMYGWMAFVTFVVFHHELRPSSVVFWFMMQLGMFAGFATSYPVNWVLLRRGLKEAM